jgi:hypothetical protein
VTLLRTLSPAFELLTVQHAAAAALPVQVVGCCVDLLQLNRRYNLKKRLCPEHLKVIHSHNPSRQAMPVAGLIACLQLNPTSGAGTYQLFEHPGPMTETTCAAVTPSYSAAACTCAHKPHHLHSTLHSHTNAACPAATALTAAAG